MTCSNAAAPDVATLRQERQDAENAFGAACQSSDISPEDFEMVRQRYNNAREAYLRAMGH